MTSLYEKARVNPNHLLWGDYIHRNKLNRDGIINVLNKIIDGSACLAVTPDGFYFLRE